MASARKPAAMKAATKKARRTAAPKVKRPAGRPTLHTPELAAALCQYLMRGMSLRRACEQEGMPHRDTVLNWIHDDTGGFFGQYRRACAARAEVQRDEIIDIADTPTRMATVEVEKVKGKKTPIPVLVAFDAAEVSHRKLQINTRQWDMARQAPKVYGERLGLDNAGEGGLLVVVKDFTGRKDEPPQEGSAP